MVPGSTFFSSVSTAMRGIERRISLDLPSRRPRQPTLRAKKTAQDASADQLRQFWSETDPAHLSGEMIPAVGVGSHENSWVAGAWAMRRLVFLIIEEPCIRRPKSGRGACRRNQTKLAICMSLQIATLGTGCSLVLLKAPEGSQPPQDS